MNSTGIVPADGVGSSSGGDETNFKDILSDALPGMAAVEARSGLPGPASIQHGASVDTDERAPTFLDDAFLVVDDVSTATTETGEEVAVVSGEAFAGADAALADAAEKGGALILPVSSGQTISGSVFASLLLDQRNGVLPNPFSLWTLPDRYMPPEAEDPAGPTIPFATGIDGPDGMRDTPADADSLSMGQEMSRLEATISQISIRLGHMLTAIRSLMGSGPDR